MSDKNTRERLLAAARDEFMEKGYAKGSLRSICKKAEVTTGALYFFYKDKQDLFGELVREPAKQLFEVMENHYSYENEEYEGPDRHLNEDFSGDYEASRDALKIIYDNFDAFYLLLVKAEGSGYENIVDEFIEVTEKHFRGMLNRLAEQSEIPYLNDYMIHWISRLEIEAFARLVEHRIPREEAEEQLMSIVRFLINGTMGFFKN